MNQEKSKGESKKAALIEWMSYPIPRKLHKFIYSRKNFILALLVALMTYAVTSGQPELIRRTLSVFVFSAGCWVLEFFPLPITGLMIPIAPSLLGVFTPDEAFRPFSHPVIFLLIGGLVLGQAIRKHEIDKWIAYSLMAHSKGKGDRRAQV